MKAIMVMFDSLNRHMLSPYGCDWTHTPNFQRLAQHTVVFDRNYICSMPCMPARRDLHTGRPGFLHRGWGPLEPFDDSMPAILKDNGVHSHLVTDHYHYFECGGANYHTQYATWEFVRGQEGDPWKGRPDLDLSKPGPDSTGQWRRQDVVNRLYMPDEARHYQTRTFDRGLEFLDDNHSTDDWFLQIESFDPHEPFFAAERFRDLFPDDYTGTLSDWPPYGDLEENSCAHMIDHWRNAYASLLAQCDASLGRVLDKMDALDLWSDTMLIVNTDHGFLLGEHNHAAKNVMPLWQELANTPLFVWDPRAGRQDERCDCLTSSIDWAPTILDYFGREPTPDMLGRSLRPCLEDNSPVRDYAIFGYHGHYVNVTDGRFVYMRPAATDNNSPLRSYTLSPFNMNVSYELEQLRSMSGPQTFAATKDVGVLCYEAGAGAADVMNRFGTLLYDVVADPQQQNPIDDAEQEQRLLSAMVEMMTEMDAPPEQYERLGIELQPR